ncbi:Cyclin [Macleaya cordata]|uniref:Cyclin n=1 Tax=Macleaya cordata TaxID=56857 RepID=A0A200R0M5_MACCD|nr:Cyclin [Macleaya cordata]
MPFSCSDCLPDLLCCEDAGSCLADDDELRKYSPPDLEFPSDIEESIARFVEEEGEYVPGFDYLERFQSQSLDASARQESVAWILKVNAFFCFQPLTAYLSVNYMDRFLASRCLPQANGWPLRLLSVACLSLAAKMEEPIVPSLLDLQVESSKLIFDPRTIIRMELIVLSALDWRLRSITPFTFIDFFAYKVDSTGTLVRLLVSRATQIILHIIKDINFIDYCASSVAVAAILCAANEIPNLSYVKPGNAVEWCHGLSKDRIVSCYELMQEVLIDNSPRSKPKLPKVPPQLRMTTRAAGIDSSCSNSSSSSTSSSSSSSSSNKRRKLNNLLWVDDDYDDEDKDKF